MTPVLACLVVSLPFWDLGEPEATWPVLIAAAGTALAQVFVAFMARDRLRLMRFARTLSERNAWEELRMLQPPGWLPEAIAAASLIVPFVVAFAVSSQDINAHTVESSIVAYLAPWRRIALLHAALVTTLASSAIAAVSLAICAATRVRLHGYARAAVAAAITRESSNGHPYRACSCPSPEVRAWALVPGPRPAHLLFAAATAFALVLLPAAVAAHLHLAALVDSFNCWGDAPATVYAQCRRERYADADQWATVAIALPLAGLLPTLLAFSVAWVRPYRRRRRLAPTLPGWPLPSTEWTVAIALVAGVGSAGFLAEAARYHDENRLPVQAAEAGSTPSQCTWSTNPRGKAGKDPIPDALLLDPAAKTVDHMLYHDTDTLRGLLESRRSLALDANADKESVRSTSVVIVCRQDLDTRTLGEVLGAVSNAGYQDVYLGISRPSIENRPLFGDIEGCSYSSVHAKLAPRRASDAVDLSLFDSCWQLQEALTNLAANGRPVRLAGMSYWR